jgi:hypothetical protein
LGEIGEEITGEVESAVRKDVDLYKRCVQVSVQSTVFPVADKKADK